MTVAAKLVGAAATLGLGVLARTLLTRGRRFVLMLHGVTSFRRVGVSETAQAGHTVEELQRILGWIAPRFRFLPICEFFESDAPGVLLTFDDGLANNAANALPVLELFGAPAVFFVATQHVKDPIDWLPYTLQKVRSHWSKEEEVSREVAADLFDGMSEQQVRRCAEHPLITIGSHTVSHPFLTQIDDDELKQEVEISREYLEAVTGQPVNLFAYPTGDYDSCVMGAVERAGYEFAFAVDPAGLGNSRLEIPRIGLYGAATSYLDLKLSGLHRRPIKARPWSR